MRGYVQLEILSVVSSLSFPEAKLGSERASPGNGGLQHCDLVNSILETKPKQRKI